MPLLSDFANDYHNMGLSFPNSNPKKFLTKTIFVYLMVGNIILSWLQKHWVDCVFMYFTSFGSSGFHLFRGGGGGED
jgi:hypothetical protein